MRLALSFVDVTNASEILMESSPRVMDPALDYWKTTTLKKKEGTSVCYPSMECQTNILFCSNLLISLIFFYNKFYWAVLTCLFRRGAMPNDILSIIYYSTYLIDFEKFVLSFVRSSNEG